MTKKITEKKWFIILSVAYAISMIPAFIIGLYAFPYADDFSAGDMGHIIYLQTHSSWDVISSAWENVVYNYNNWSGVFASVFWTSLQPGIWGEKYYFLSSWLVMTMLIVSILFFTHKVLYCEFKIGKSLSYCIGILFLFLIMQCSVSGVEAFYWHAGAVNYTLPTSFLFVLLALLLGESSRVKWKLYVKTIIICSLSVLIGGGNYITAVETFLILSVVLLNRIIIKRGEKRELIVSFASYLFFLISFLVSVLAPGNAVRMQTSTGMSPIKAVLYSFYYCIKYFVGEWLSVTLVLLILFSVPFLWQAVKQTKMKYNHPIVAVFIAFCIASAAYTPNLYAQGEMQAGRLENTIYIFVLFMVYVSIFYLLGWIRDILINKDCEKIDYGIKYCGMGIFVLLILFVLISGMRRPNQYLGTSALNSLLNGEAIGYKVENKVRCEQLYSTQQDIFLAPYENRPYLLYMGDISTDSEEWLNYAMAEYYEKDTIKLK